MLTVYNNMRTLFNRQAEANNDLFFSELRFTSAFDYKDPIISHLIKEIDNGIPKDKNNFKAKNGDNISYDYLSTGCKTAINIYCNPDKWFDTVECGNNAILEILKLPKGKAVIFRKPYYEGDFDLNLDLITSYGTFHCTEYSDVDYYWDGGQ